jgi:hypothetical protein
MGRVDLSGADGVSLRLRRRVAQMVGAPLCHYIYLKTNPLLLKKLSALTIFEYVEGVLTAVKNGTDAIGFGVYKLARD